MSQPTPNTGSTNELPKTYRPAEHESVIRARWDAARAFHTDPQRVLRGERKPYAILIPPPNVTARLHLGHALNNTLQDVLTRAHRMRGYEALWMPGTDHAGIATQAVVERRLREEGKLKGPLKDAFSRDEFVAKVQEWKDEYEKVITDQLKLMGCSCDWDRQRFTMDDVCAKAVREAFFRLFRDGLIYRGKRLVNWDPALQTAVADDECFDEEVGTSFWYLRYPLVRKTGDAVRPVTWDELARAGYAGASDRPGDQQAWVTVATTRPETYLGDTAVAVNPHDPRAKALRGLSVELPLVGRVIPIIEDSYVVLPEAMARTEEEKNDPKAKFATGFLKVTPAHDANDYELGQRHKLAMVNMMSPDGRVSDKHGWTDVGDAHLFVGLTMAEARKKVVAEFKARTIPESAESLLEAIRPYTQSQTFSDRSKAQIEPYLSDQWYVRVTDERLAASANAALVAEQTSHKKPARTKADGTMTFYPARYAKTYEQWHDNIRDWCISRQLWWGHRIPVWTMTIDLVPHASQDTRDEFERKQKSSHRDAIGRLEQYLEKCGVDRADWAEKPLNNWQSFICARTERCAAALASLELWRDSMEVKVVTPGENIEAALASPPGFEHARDEAFGVFEPNVFAFKQDPDVLDTWFSSALWPLSTLGWPHANEQTKGLLDAFNPTSALCTAREIITLWVSRMVMMNRYFLGEGQGKGPAPFADVFIHAVIQDGEGQKMSKSLGNGVDPLDIIDSHGSDAMRFTLSHMSTHTQDVRLSVDLICPHTGETFAPKMITNKDGYVVPAPVQSSPKDPSKKMVTAYGVASGEVKPSADMPLARNTSSKFDLGRNFANKLWNASRFAMSILDKAHAAGSPAGSTEPATPIDRWMVSRLAKTIEEIDHALANYEFSRYATELYRLVWDDFCDWYLEGIKPTVASSGAQQRTLALTLDAILRLAHPLMPFITEAINEKLAAHRSRAAGQDAIRFDDARFAHTALLCHAGWPQAAPAARDAAAESAFEDLKHFVTAVREVRAQHNVPPKRKVTLIVPAAAAARWEPWRGLIQTLAGVETFAPTGSGGVTFAFDAAEYRVTNLADAVDAGAERVRLAKAIADLEKTVATLNGRLSNPGYVDRAPPAMVQQTKDQLTKAQGDLDAAKKSLASLA